MPVGTSDGDFYEDSHEHAISEAEDKPRTRVYITKSDPNDTGTSDPTMPPGGPTEPADAFKSTGGTGTPENGYNTSLSPEEQADYNTKFSPQDSEEYDMQGWYKANPNVDPHTDGSHYTDQYKKPNHPTFSNQSQYHSDDTPGGEWTTDANGGDVFTPGPQNVKNGIGKTQDYLKWSDPNVTLNYNDASKPLGEPVEGLGKLSIVNAVKGMANPSFDEDKKILSGFYDTVKSAFSLPGDVYGGKVDPTSRQGIERAADLAGLMITGPAPVAGKMADGTLGSFMGVRSNTIDKTKLYRAQEMEMGMSHPDDIWNETGTFRGADARWRQEIPDNAATLRHENLDVKKPTQIDIDPSVPEGWQVAGDGDNPGTVGIKPTHTGQENFTPKTVQDFEEFWNKVIKGQKDKPTVVKDVLDHPELFKAYPDIGNIKLRRLEDYPNPSGQDMSNVEGVHMPGEAIYMKASSPEEFKTTLLHELQHAIQEKEGFAGGGNSGMFLPPQLAQAKIEFANIKKEAMLSSQKELGTVPDVVEKYKDLIKRRKNGEDLSSNVISKLKEIEDKHPDTYKRLSNVAQSEALIEQAEATAFQNYRRLMGEVESRNVERRMNMSNIELARQSPKNTQDIPSFKQLNRNELPRFSEAEMSVPGQFTPHSPRWPNNDNVKPLNEFQEHLRDYDELKALGDRLGMPIKRSSMSDKFGTTGSKRWSDLDYQKYNNAGRAMAKKWSQRWEKYPAWEDIKPINR